MLSWLLRAMDWKLSNFLWPYRGCRLDLRDRIKAHGWIGLFADERLGHFNGSEGP
jgi:hypothetical protein